MARCSLLLVLLIGGAAGAGTYPVSARLTLAPQDAHSCLALSQEVDCRILPAVQDAFARTVEPMFTPLAPGDLRLELSIKSVEVTGIELDLYVRVRVLAPDGRLIDELISFGSAPALDRASDTLARSERAAAEVAAHDFERVYAAASNVGNYLVANKIAGPGAVGVVVRSDRLITIAAAFGLMEGGGDDSFAIAPSLRVAGAAGWGFVQASFSHYSSPFVGASKNLGRPGNAALATNDLGLEAGVVFRFRDSLEVRAGPGLHFLLGSASLDEDSATNPSFTKLAPALYASFATSFLAGRNGPRFSFGIEARAYFFTSVDLPEMQRTVPAANVSAAVFLGLELPWNSTPENR